MRHKKNNCQISSKLDRKNFYSHSYKLQYIYILYKYNVYRYYRNFISGNLCELRSTKSEKTYVYYLYVKRSRGLKIVRVVKHAQRTAV